MKILITGGAGFIGSALIRYLIEFTSAFVINIDKLTYASNLQSLAKVKEKERYIFYQMDICSSHEINDIFFKHQPDAVMHLAAESHVDRSILSAADFIQTNIIGTYTLLEAVRTYWGFLSGSKRSSFRFHHISTDEVYGELQSKDEIFTETTAYAPSSPYSASKASADHLVRAWHRTYGIPVLITNCSNNYGPYQFPEKLIPLTILNALSGNKISVYGEGSQIRDWLYVDDHVHGLYQVLNYGTVGATYNIGGNNEKQNIEVVQKICLLLEEIASDKPIGVNQYIDLVSFVKDRPGHDRRYAIDTKKIKSELGWQPKENFESGLKKTVQWYFDNQNWYKDILK